MTVRARVTTSFQTGVNPTGVEIPVLDGDVTSDANARVTSTLDISTDGRLNGDPLTQPFGNEIYVERGIYYGDESVEWVGLGYYRIDAAISSSSLSELRLMCKDRMAQIIDSRLPKPLAFWPGMPIEDIFATLILGVFPSAVIEYDWVPGTLTIERRHVCERERYDFLRELATARGKIFYFDYRGVLVIKDLPIVALDAHPVFIVNSGKDGVLLEPLSEESTREGIYNAVVAFGEGTDEMPPARALVYDNNPLSRTYWFGPFGNVPRFFFSSFITTNTQAIQSATTLLNRILGEPYSIDLSMVPNPALEVFDLIEIIAPNRSSRRQLLQTVRIPLSPMKDMSCNAQDKTNVILGDEE